MFLRSVILGSPFFQILEQWRMNPVRAVEIPAGAVEQGYLAVPGSGPHDPDDVPAVIRPLEDTEVV